MIITCLDMEKFRRETAAKVLVALIRRAEGRQLRVDVTTELAVEMTDSLIRELDK